MRRAICSLAVLLSFAPAAQAGNDLRAARLENVRKEWQNAYGAIIYTVLADVTNVSDHPLQSVRVKVSLFDKTGALVAERDGYNAGAEVLDEPSGGSAADKQQRVKPIPPGGKDLFRLSLDKTDIGKPFRTTTVEVVEVH
jgi:hypothetical protein